ncbi:hypothetical protein Palpr_2205 [Paludibacter propionicigenes WB4]|uniref:Uncharacterized protein n=1 Tax=Paludibacter propionicigenes (strain DSM 17365 / JCM 13257 / WB4) TaxID=694427 RepID=E4T6J7_PALPW|nr:hypothetical protein Palpr_2205 [Paludibacter propionicigenes WB4]
MKDFIINVLSYIKQMYCPISRNYVGALHLTLQSLLSFYKYLGTLSL